MANVKLGNLTFEGVEKVKLNTTDGGEALLILEDISKEIEAKLLSYGGMSGEYRNDNPINMKPYAFSGCVELESVDLPNAINDVGEHCFESCFELKNVNLPKIEAIYDQAFCNCNQLTVLDFPSARIVSTIAFTYCPKLKAVVLRSTEISGFRYSDSMGSPAEAFEGTPITDGTGYFYVPREMIPVWQEQCTDMELTIGSQFRALEDYTVDGTITGELDFNKITVVASQIDNTVYIENTPATLNENTLEVN